MLNEDELLEYFIQQNRILDLEHLSKKYISYGGLKQVFKIANALVAKGLIETVPNAQNHWIVSETTKAAYKAKVAKDIRNEERASKEYEKLHYELGLLQNQFSDYPETKRKANISFNLSIVTIAIAALALLQQWTCNKPG